MRSLFNWMTAAVGGAGLVLGLVFGGCVGTGVGYKLAQWGPSTPPIVKPVDPKPDPKPDTTKISVGQARILIINESATRSVEEWNLYSSTALNEYVGSVCIKDNGQPAFRQLDKEVNTVNAAKWLDSAVKRAKANPKFSVIWLVIFADDKPEPRYEGPLPTLKAAELIEFIKGFIAGQQPTVTPKTPVVVAPPVVTQPAQPFTPVIAERD